MVWMMILGLLLGIGGWLVTGALLDGEENGAARFMASAIGVMLAVLAAVIALLGLVVIVRDVQTLRDLGPNPSDEVAGLRPMLRLDILGAAAAAVAAASFALTRFTT